MAAVSRPVREPLRTRYGLMFAPEDDNVIGRSLKLYGEWAQHELDVLCSYVESDGTVLDVGANIGTHTLAFSARFPNSTVVAFEPQPFVFQLLCANVTINQRFNVTPFNLACSNKRRLMWASLEYSKLGSNVGACNLEDIAVPSAKPFAVPISVATIDNISYNSQVQLIKIDVEGMESKVLSGGIRTIERNHPVIYLEVLALSAMLDCRAVLEPLGYSLYWLETWPYHHGNFNGTAINVWSACELGVLALPPGRACIQKLEPVTGIEEELPLQLDPSLGYGGA
jgi:FkbM family methyltransferase